MQQIGRYQVEGEIGRGAMGIVYAGFDPFLKRRVAVKTVLPSSASRDQPWEMLIKRLAREAQAAAGLNHPNLVGVYDIVETQDLFCVVMEFVDGQSLADAVPPNSPAPPEFVNRILTECAAALDHAHSRGVIHRDIKPGNIMLDRAGSAKIADFGIAKLLDSGTDLTGGFALGTLEYMSPEQLNSAPVDGRTDQYSLAVVAYRLLTGGKIYDVQTVGAWCAMALTGQPVPATTRNPSLPGAVDAVFGRALAKQREARYESCSRFVDEMRRALTATIPVEPATLKMAPASVGAEFSTKKTTKARWWKFRVELTIAFGCLVAGVVGIGVLQQTKRGPEAGRPVEVARLEPKPDSPQPPSSARPEPASQAGRPVDQAKSSPEAAKTSVPAAPPLSNQPPTSTGDKQAAPAVDQAKSAPLPETAAPPPATPPLASQPVAPPFTPGTKRTNSADGLTYVWIPPGEFQMGCSLGESCDDDEKPQHKVRISRGFWLGETEVTQTAYQKVNGTNPSNFKGEDLPVEQVSWTEANQFCKAAGGRLPTEAEWEYAARAGSTAARYGDAAAIGWSSENSGGKTHPVKTKVANAWGLYDMLGNVWEWVADWYDAKYYAGRPALDIDPNNQTPAEFRVLRGKSWFLSATFLRAAYRLGTRPGGGDDSVGFRCVQDRFL